MAYRPPHARRGESSGFRDGYEGGKGSWRRGTGKGGGGKGKGGGGGKGKGGGGGYNWRKHLPRDNPDHCDDATWYGMDLDQRDSWRDKRRRDEPEYEEQKKAYREEKRAAALEKDTALLAAIAKESQGRDPAGCGVHREALTPEEVAMVARHRSELKRKAQAVDPTPEPLTMNPTRAKELAAAIVALESSSGKKNPYKHGGDGHASEGLSLSTFPQRLLTPEP